MTFWQDIRYSIRSLRQNPVLTITCFLVLALGIGANTAIFSAVKAILLDPLPYRDPGQLVALYEAGVVQGDVHDAPAPANFYDWQRESTGFQEIAAYGGTNGNLSGEADQLPEHINGIFCSWNLFRTLGVAPTIGRVFVSSDDTPKATRTIILSDSLWRRRLAGNPNVIGRTLRLDAQLYTIIGVMPSTLEFPEATTQFWIPMQLALPAEELQTRQDHRLSVIGRLKAGNFHSSSDGGAHWHPITDRPGVFRPNRIFCRGVYAGEPAGWRYASEITLCALGRCCVCSFDRLCKCGKSVIDSQHRPAQRGSGTNGFGCIETAHRSAIPA